MKEEKNGFVMIESISLKPYKQSQELSTPTLVQECGLGMSMGKFPLLLLRSKLIGPTIKENHCDKH